MTKFHQLCVTFLCLFAFGMSALISDQVFEHLPHLEDEMAYLYQAQVFARGYVVTESPTPRRSYWRPFVVDFSPGQGQPMNRFGKYTPGYPALLAFGVAMGREWVINAFFAALNVALVYRLGREVFSRDAGLIAAALTAFSPMALLLNGTLMTHTSTMTFVILFMWSYFRLEREGRYAVWWGVAAGLSLGMIAASRPLTAVATAAPFVLWSLVRLTQPLLEKRKHEDLVGETNLPSMPSRILRTFRPLLALGVSALIIAASIPAFNYIAAGNPFRNLYTLVWEYDAVGFGECCGRSGHTLEKGIRNLRFDMSMFTADLFGWQLGSFNDALRQYALEGNRYWLNFGLSWLLLPIGLWLGMRAERRTFLIWTGIALLWTVFWLTLYQSIETLRAGMLGGLWRQVPVQTYQNIQSVLQVPQWGWIFITMSMALLLAPILELRETTARRTWLIFTVSMGLIVIHMAYWIGSQIYSTRYWFEGLAGWALLAALPLAGLAEGNLTQRQKGTEAKSKNAIVWTIERQAVYIGLALVLVYSLFAYSQPRIEVLYRYNHMSPEILQEVEARRDGSGRPVLVLVNGPNSGDNAVRWRAVGEIMAISSPFFDSEILGAWAYNEEVRQEILAAFPDRQVIELDAIGNDTTFRDAVTPNMP